MRPIFLVWSFSVLFALQLAAQDYLSGHWKGFITGGLDNKVGLIFELYLEVKGNAIKGRTYTTLENGKIVEAEVVGQIYSDRSVFLQEVGIVLHEEGAVKESRSKRYQFIHNRSIFESDNTLNGYWQEVVESPLSLKRKRGKVFMKRVKGAKA